MRSGPADIAHFRLIAICRSVPGFPTIIAHHLRIVSGLSSTLRDSCPSRWPALIIVLEIRERKLKKILNLRLQKDKGRELTKQEVKTTMKALVMLKVGRI